MTPLLHPTFGDGSEEFRRRYTRLTAQGIVALELPLDIVTIAPGQYSSAVQLLSTWICQTGDKSLVSPSKDLIETMEYFKRLCSTEHGLVAAFSASQCLTASGTDVSRYVQSLVYQTYGTSYSKPFQSDNRLAIMVFEESAYPRTTASFARLAVNGERSARKVSFLYVFREHLRLLLEKSGTPRPSELLREAISEMVYELFANCEEWGSRSVDGTSLARSVRFITLKVFANQGRHNLRSNFPAAATGPFSQYLSNIADVLRNPNSALLEVDVFDNGIGLARRMAGEAVGYGGDVQAEYGLVRRCMGKHSTTSSVGGRGRGLFEVMQCLTKAQGFLFFRGGKLSLYRDFVSHKHLVTQEIIQRSRDRWFANNMEFLLDVSSDSEKVQEHPQASGALFTAWLPLPAPVQMSLF